MVLLAGTAGLVVDAGLNAIGFLSPGEVGVAAATVALGGKKAYEQSRAKSKAEAAEARALDAVIVRANRTYSLLRSRGLDSETRRLEVELELFMDGLSDAPALEAVVEATLVEYRRKIAATTYTPL